MLNINPNGRPTARQVIESNYLKEYKGVDNLDIRDFEKLEEYKKYLQSTIINHEIFINLIKNINRKENEITSNSNILIFSNNNNNNINEQEKNEILI